MTEIEALKERREQLLSEAQDLQAEMLPYEKALESEEALDPDQKREVRDKYNDLKRQFDSRDFEASQLDHKINRRENFFNCDSIMAGYLEAMSNWKTDEQELNDKRQSLSTRLEQVSQQTIDDMAKARQAETDAATAYAQAVAWGDTEGEKNANADALKAAKNLAAATEQNRRQQLIINALELELATVDKYIAEAQQEHLVIEKEALHLAHNVLEEKWNQAAQALLDVGGKLWASYRLINRDQVSLMKLALPEQGENYGAWKSGDLADRSYKHTVHDILAM
ncbi:chromosome segregation protein SMC [Pseudomonas sp. PDM04]|uniref:chromosome segregation protein SMC n=1 Tax=Pseudomonas sp. PDM04 TaxID=2769296 RepID=UPI0017840613|nr:chromosome segregation protein SMC [Pseudomonas sp. PDM04]MBD9439408.1 chromosome segregation protein SMC [Pseudomonas sp. PDM04]